jgi:2-succinyl-5-enolpyruvyl-6-hydroxy-3-cyclohexene-1-carboxylate synthase
VAAAHPGRAMTAPNPSTALATTLIDELIRCGVRHLCLAPGSRSAPLAIAAARSSMDVHVSIDERSASFLALGIAKATRSPAAVVCTSGSAAANLFPAVIEAHHSTTPLLTLTADRPPELRATAANQTIDQIKMFGDAVRFFAEAGIAEDSAHSRRYWRSLAGRVVAEATGSPPGPVHLNLAFREPLVPDGDDFGADTAGGEDGGPWTEVVRSPAIPDEAVLDDLVHRLAGRRAALVAGDCRIDGDAVVDLAEAAGWPVLAEPLSGMRRGPNAISTYDALVRVEKFASSHRPEVVVRVGKTGTSKVLPGWLEGVEQILIDPHGRWLDPERALDRIVVADPAVVAMRLTERVAGAGGGWIESWRVAEDAARDAIDGLLDATDEPTEPRVARDLAALLPDGSTLVVASSMPVRDLDRTMAVRAGLRILGNRGASGIDGFVSTTMGVALGGGAPTFALAGDLSMLHDSNGLTLTSNDRPEVVFVVLNNDGGGIFSFLPQAKDKDFELLFGTPHGLSFEHLATLHRCGYARLERASDLPGLLQGTGVTIVEVRTDRDANVDIHRRMSRVVADALA